MAKNSVNDNGLESNVPAAIKSWYWCKKEINELTKRQVQLSKDIKAEIESARESGYTEEEIKRLIGNVTIPSWYLIENNINR